MYEPTFQVFHSIGKLLALPQTVNYVVEAVN
jgi:hypothetical protein